MEFIFIKNKVSKVFIGNVVKNVHKGMNVSYGNVEVFKLDGGGVMYDIKSKKGGLPFMLVNCMKKGSIFGVFGVSCFYIETVIANM